MEDQSTSEFMQAPPEPSSWSQDRRLKFIDFRLRWEGRVNRTDLMSYFEISPPQASADFAKYAAAAPKNLIYDGRLKTYVRTQEFSPVYPRSRSQLYLNELLAVSTGILDRGLSFVGWQPEVGVAPIPSRTFRSDTLAALLQAIREKRSVKVSYQSMTHPEPRERDLSPHALAYDGMRWHARAYCHTNMRHQDFVLGRILQATIGEQLLVDTPDEEWDRELTLVLAPAPWLEPAAKRAIRLEYGMTDGFLELTCRQALLFYALRRLRLEEPFTEGSPAQQITLVNRQELQPFIDQVESKASDGTRPAL